MTIFDWTELLVTEMGDILLRSVWNSLAMGVISFILAGIALSFNHYNWRRVKVLTGMTFVSLISWILLKILILGKAGFEGAALTSTAFSVLLALFVSIGLLIAGIISDMSPNPVVRLKELLIRYLRMTAQNIENTITDSEKIRAEKEIKIAEQAVEIISTMAKINPS